MIKTDSYKKGFVASISLNVVAKGILFLNTIVIAYFFGTSLDTDLYFYVFSLVSLIATFINGMDLSVIIPEAMHLQEKEGKDAAIRFYNFFGFIYLCIGLVLFILLLFFALPVYNAISTFQKNVLAGNRLLLMSSSILPVLIILSNYLSTVLTTLKYFTAPLIVSMIVQVLILIALVLFHDRLGITSAIIGMIAGYALNLVMLLFLMRFKLKWRFNFSVQHLSRRIKKNLVSVQLGNLATVAYNYGIILILSSLGAGVYSAYNYSMQVVNIPNTFIVTQAASVVGIKFTDLCTKRLYAEVDKLFRESVGILLFLTVPICYLFSLYAKDIVELLFFRGDFGQDSVALVTKFLQFLIFLTPCFLINTLVSRIMAADRKVSESFYFQIMFNVVSLLLLFAGYNYFEGNGFIFIMLGTYYLYIIFVCSFLFKWVLPYINYQRILYSLFMILLFNIPFIWLCHEVFGMNQPLFMLAFIGIAYYLAVFIANHFIKVSDPTNLYLTQVFKELLVKQK